MPQQYLLAESIMACFVTKQTHMTELWLCKPVFIFIKYQESIIPAVGVSSWSVAKREESIVNEGQQQTSLATAGKKNKLKQWTRILSSTFKCTVCDYWWFHPQDSVNDKVTFQGRCENLKSMKTVAGIKKISLQAMNLRMFCWLAVSLSKRFLTNIRLLGPMDCRGKSKRQDKKTLMAWKLPVQRSVKSAGQRNKTAAMRTFWWFIWVSAAIWLNRVIKSPFGWV